MRKIELAANLVFLLFLTQVAQAENACGQAKVCIDSETMDAEHTLHIVNHIILAGTDDHGPAQVINLPWNNNDLRIIVNNNSRSVLLQASGKSDFELGKIVSDVGDNEKTQLTRGFIPNPGISFILTSSAGPNQSRCGTGIVGKTKFKYKTIVRQLEIKQDATTVQIVRKNLNFS